MSPVSVARLTARQEHTLSPYSPVSPTFGQTAFKFRELFSAFSRSAATPHQSRRQAGALSPASVSFHFVGKGPLFYKKTSPISFPCKKHPPISSPAYGPVQPTAQWITEQHHPSTTTCCLSSSWRRVPACPAEVSAGAVPVQRCWYWMMRPRWCWLMPVLRRQTRPASVN